MNLHTPVLLKEILEYLDPKPNENYIDCTLGLGGHSIEILKRNGPGGKILGIDQDKEALEIAKRRLEKFQNRLIVAHGHFKDLAEIVRVHNFSNVSGILFDLGLSGLQIASQRGFSFQKNSRLDMRMNQDEEISAYDIVNNFKGPKLYEIFHELGEEKHSRRIANEIIKQRRKKKIETTFELADIVSRSIPKTGRRKIHPATKIFQALRIYINAELYQLKSALPEALKILKPGGKLLVISFHSLEDRIVKNFFKKESQNCICPAEIPMCVCGHKKSLKIITKKPIIAEALEVAGNPRSRSAKLRVAQKIK